MMQNVILSVVTGSLFWDLDKAAFQDQPSRLGLFFLLGLTLMTGAMPFVPVYVQKQSVLYKQRDANFFPPAAWSLTMSLAHVSKTNTKILLMKQTLFVKPCSMGVVKPCRAVP